MTRFAGACAFATAAAGFLYSLAFVLLRPGSPGLGALLTGLFLCLGGVLGTAALTGLYEQLREDGGGFALWALVLGVAAGIVAALHGGHDLANAIHPPAQPGSALSEVDPRGLGTFGLAGLALGLFGWLIGRERELPKGLGYGALVSGALLIIVYLGRLIVLDASSPLILVPAALEGFIINPLWYLWLGLALRRHRQLKA